MHWSKCGNYQNYKTNELCQTRHSSFVCIWSVALEPLGDVGNDRGLSPAAWISDAAGSCCGLPGIAPEPGRWIVSILGTWYVGYSKG